jgi:hypothetical protein
MHLRRGYFNKLMGKNDLKASAGHIQNVVVLYAIRYHRCISRSRREDLQKTICDSNS